MYIFLKKYYFDFTFIIRDLLLSHYKFSVVRASYMGASMLHLDIILLL